MKTRLLSVITIFGLVVPLAVQAQARDGAGFRELNHTLTVQPVLLAVPIGVVMYEVRLTEPLGVSVFGGYGRFDYERDDEQVDATVYGAGMQTRFYFLDRRQSGGNEPHIGLQALWAHGEGEEEDGGLFGVFGDEVWGRGEQFMAGPFVGYKYTAPFGLTLEAQAGMMAGARYSYGGEDNSGVDEDAKWEFKWLPIANIGIGWSF